MTMSPPSTLPFATTLPFTSHATTPARQATEWRQALADAHDAAGHPDDMSARTQEPGPAPPRTAVPKSDLSLIDKGALRAPVNAAGQGGIPSSPIARPEALRHVIAAPCHYEPAWVGSSPGGRPADAAGPGDAGEPLWVRTRFYEPTDPATPRVHVEQHPDGLAIWLGLRAADAARVAQTSALLDALRRQWPGAPVVSLVCNGQSLFSHVRSFKEHP